MKTYDIIAIIGIYAPSNIAQSGNKPYILTFILTFTNQNDVFHSYIKVITWLFRHRRLVIAEGILWPDY